ncbi:synaptic vesicle 2-related protein [Trichonephila inaurata madagascariensis]|uniref:Synaptic vesicle 2-related protein n=1 Tax=Trichonephila inaurata madagascariensis TaxID=2747483 RepID=A0A8X7C531_9ARAC|nr:synaptic vesicle 2-related protein [Trichonephila inaurata madagascariensis]
MFVVGACGGLLATSVGSMLAYRCLLGFAIGGKPQAFVLCIEYCPAKDRGTTGLFIACAWTCGALVFVTTASFVIQVMGSWRMLLVVTSLPSLVVLFLIKWYPESARYFLVSRQYDRAVKQLEEMLDMNKVFMPPGKLRELKINENRGSVKNLFKKEHIITTILLWYIRKLSHSNIPKKKSDYAENAATLTSYSQ